MKVKFLVKQSKFSKSSLKNDLISYCHREVPRRSKIRRLFFNDTVDTFKLALLKWVYGQSLRIWYRVIPKVGSLDSLGNSCLASIETKDNFDIWADQGLLT
mgnify:CR=1 FL=1